MKNIVITGGICLLIGAGLGAYLFPQTKIETVEKEKEVVRKDIVTVVKEVIRPDGTKETTSTTTDKSRENKDSTLVSKIKQSSYLISVSAATSDTKLQDIEYGLQVQKRIFGPLFLGATINTKKSVGLSVGMEF